MATITTINATDLVSASRAVINTNFSNLNTAKVDGATALTTAGRLVEVASSGVATQTSFASSVVVLTSGSYADPAWVTSLATTKLTGTLQAAQFPALTGDVTTSAGAVATTLANTAVTPASYGSATQVATFTVDSKGRLTAAASTSIAIAASQVTSGTLDNARTTAASTNTVSAIVARDASGNFAAGTITATFSGNLTGNVTGNASGTAATITGALALANTPLTTRGDLLVATTATPILGRLAKGTQYQVLTGGATDPTWGAVDLSQATAITGTLPVGNGGTGATTLAGAGIVAGAASITTANALLIGASAGTLGQSDVSLASGIFSRAGTLGLSATGANVVTITTQGVDRVNVSSSGAVSLIRSVPFLQLADSIAGGTRKEFTISVDTANSRVEMQAIQQGVAAWPLAINPVGGNLLIGTTTDDGSSKLQVAGRVAVTQANASITTTNSSAASYAYHELASPSSSGYLYAFGNTYVTSGRFVQSSTLLEGTAVGGLGISATAGPITFWTGTNKAGSLSTTAFTLYNETPTTGVTSLVVRAGAGQSTTALQQWADSAGSVGSSINSDGTRFTTISVYAQKLAMDTQFQSGFAAASDQYLSWSSDTTYYGSKDIALKRASAGVLEVNNGSAGTLRDITTRSLLGYNSTIYDSTAVTGVTSLVVRAGAGQSTAALQTWQNNAGTALSWVSPVGTFRLADNTTEYIAASTRSGGTNNGNYGVYVNHTSEQLQLVGGSTPVIGITTNKVGFFGATPVARQTALTAADASALNTGDATSDTVIGNMRTRIGEIATALQNLGLIN